MLHDEGAVISWKSKKQSTIALSTCESEYMALSMAVQEALFLERLVYDLIIKVRCINASPVHIYVDNQGAIALSKNQIVNNRSKHIDVKYHFVREHVINEKIKLIYIRTDENLADILTKPCSKVKLLKFKSKLFGGVDD